VENKLPRTYQEHEVEWNDEKTSRLWDYYSRTPPFSDVYFSKLFGNHILRQSELKLAEPLRVLDFGCGPGFIWDHLIMLKSRWNYTALDFSPESISTLNKKANRHENFNGAHHVRSLPTTLPTSSFDVVLLFEVVEHLNDDYLNSTLEEVARLLKIGGVIVISTPNNENLSMSKKLCPECGAIFHEWQHVRSWTVDGLANRLTQYGFVLRKSKLLDFNAQDANLRGVLRRIRRLGRRILFADAGTPHMIAVFQKC
jgi:2-polyprenyl-3-methyl-5-hydroxy-6-metoxy-1,4-benzoquinol methylase